MTQGIYMLEIHDRYYIGKDMEIHYNKRLREHQNLLKKNKHYNKYLQRSYNKYHNIKYNKLIEFQNISKENLSKCEMFYIDLFDTYKAGYNLTKGGEGGNGLIISKEERINRSNRTTGERNPQSKLTNKQFYEIVIMLKEGKTNKEIAEKYNLHDRYVSLIRHKKRYKNLWMNVVDYTPEKSNDQIRGIDKNTFIEIVKLIKSGWTNADVERKYNLSSGTGSRIRNKRLYKRWWKEHFGE